MSNENRVIWYQGLFLRPEHFEQDFCYAESALRRGLYYSKHYLNGVRDLSVNQALLEHGKFSVSRVTGVFSDGTIFDAPTRDSLPEPKVLDVGCSGKRLFLCVPLPSEDTVLVDPTGQACMQRYIPVQTDEHQVSANSEISIAGLNLFVMLEDEIPTSMTSIAIAKVESVSKDGIIKLDNEFIASSIDVKVSNRLNEQLIHVHALMIQRADQLSNQLGIIKRSLGSNTIEFMYLQTINRYLLPWQQLIFAKRVHPYEVFMLGLHLLGDLSVFSQDGERIEVPKVEAFDQSNLNNCLTLVLDKISVELGGVMAVKAININFEKKKYGIHFAKITDNVLLSCSRAILAVKARVPLEQLRVRFPLQAKAAPAEKLSDLVQTQLPGLELMPLQTVPEQMPTYDDCVYFELNQDQHLWSLMSSSLGLAIHPGADYPDLNLELWLILKE